MKGYRTHTGLIVLGLMMAGTFVTAQDCIPSFFNTDHRDSEWYYGVGKGPDAGEGRKDALRQLYLKISGGGESLPAEVVAGWEQDDHRECQGIYYVMVRIEKSQINRNRAELKSRPQPSQSTPRSLSTVLAKLEKLGKGQKQNQQQSQQQNQSVTVQTTDSMPIVVIVVVAILAMVLAFLAFVWSKSTQAGPVAETDQGEEVERPPPAIPPASPSRPRKAMGLQCPVPGCPTVATYRNNLIQHLIGKKKEGKPMGDGNGHQLDTAEAERLVNEATS